MTARASIARLADDAPVPHPDSWPQRPPPSVARASIRAELEAQAKEAAREMINDRARKFALEPRQLNSLAPCLSSLSPKQLRFRVAQLIGEESATPRRIGGETIMLNLHAAAVYAERLCDIEDKAKAQEATP